MYGCGEIKFTNSISRDDARKSLAEYLDRCKSYPGSLLARQHSRILDRPGVESGHIKMLERCTDSISAFKRQFEHRLADNISVEVSYLIALSDIISFTFGDASWRQSSLEASSAGYQDYLQYRCNTYSPKIKDVLTAPDPLAAFKSISQITIEHDRNYYRTWKCSDKLATYNDLLESISTRIGAN